MKKKNISIEILRIISCLAVIMVHIAAAHLYEINYGTYTSFVLNIYNGIPRSSLTIFL